MSYRLIVKPGAQRQLRQLDPPLLKRIIQKMQQLQQNPRPPGVRKLRGVMPGYRVKVGDWHILYVDEQA